MAKKSDNQEEKSSGGTEQGLMIIGSKVLQYYTGKGLPARPQANVLMGAGPDEFGRGSVNHKFLRTVMALSLALINGSLSEIETCLKRLETFLSIQEQRGHCCVAEAIEFNSPTHSQLNMAAAAIAHLVLIKENRTHTKAFELLTKWFWSEITLMDLGFLNDLILGKNGYDFTCACPGWRAKTQEDTILCSNSGRDLAHRIIKGLKVPSRAQVYNQKYNLGAAALRAVGEKELKRLIPPEGWIVPAPYPVQVWKKVDNGGFFYEILVTSHPDLCSWVLFDKAELVCGTGVEAALKGPRENESFYLAHRINATEWSKTNRPQ